MGYYGYAWHGDHQVKLSLNKMYLHDCEFSHNCSFCIGTGKSKTIAGIVDKLLNDHLYERSKILVCAPSNTACDEISRRILQKLSNEQSGTDFNSIYLYYRMIVRFIIDSHTLVRIGSLVPTDIDLSNNWLTFLVLQEIFQIIQKDRTKQKVDLRKIQDKIFGKAKIIVSTLNNCTSSRLSSLVDKVALVIIDEGNYAIHKSFRATVG